jgi:gamma-glutamylaminecyclotransferase
METVFVYGTLKHGFGNHRILKYSEYFCDATTTERYNFFTLGYFPAVSKTGNPDLDIYKVDGEIYKVDGHVMALLDSLESNGQLYQRRVRDFDVLLNGELKIMTAWMYELIAETGLAPEAPHCRPDQFIVSGDVACWYRAQ